MSQTTTPSGADVLSVIDGIYAGCREKDEHDLKELRTAVAAQLARNAELEAALAEESEQLSACREDWQRVCDAIEPGVHFDPDDVIGRIAERDALAAENKALRDVVKTMEGIGGRYVFGEGTDDEIEEWKDALARTPAKENDVCDSAT